jgi:hypothetical protein
MRNLKILGKGLLILGVGLLFFSCASKPDVYVDIDAAVLSGNYEEALGIIEAAQTEKKPFYPIPANSVLLSLDRGMIQHYAGRYAESSETLQEGERLIEEAFTQSVTQDIGSFIANDNTKDYAGEAYEDVYINIFNALNYYNTGNLEGALVEVRKLTAAGGKIEVLNDRYTPENLSSDLQPEVVATFIADIVGVACAAAGLPGFLVEVPDAILTPDVPAVQFHDSALARYLSAIFYRGEGRLPDEVVNNLNAIEAIYASSESVYSNPVPASIKEEYEVPAGMARLNVIGFTGLSPIKEETIEDLDFQYFPALVALRPLDNEKMRLTYGNIALPVLVPRGAEVDRIRIEADGQTFDLELIEDIGRVMTETYNLKLPSIRAKTYIRALTKYVVVEIAAQVAYKQGLPELAVVAAAAAAKKGVDATERADIRSARYLPAKAFVGGINLAPGTYTVTVTHYAGDAEVATFTYENVNVEANTVNLMETVCLE